jgi:hypothetical protein
MIPEFVLSTKLMKKTDLMQFGNHANQKGRLGRRLTQIHKLQEAGTGAQRREFESAAVALHPLRLSDAPFVVRRRAGKSIRG